MAYATRQEMGIGEHAPKEQSEMVEAVRESAMKTALKDNVDPVVAGNAAAASVPSAAELAGAVK